MSATLTAPQSTAPRQAPAARTVEPVAASADRLTTGAAELRRWTLLLVIPFILSAVFFAGAIGAASEWLMGVAFFVGPVVLIGAYIYLSLSSDSNNEL